VAQIGTDDIDVIDGKDRRRISGIRTPLAQIGLIADLEVPLGI